MFCRSSWLRICIFRTFTRSSNCGVLSMPSFLALLESAIHCGSRLASCFFICGVTLGARWPASVSNSALVMTVLQSAVDDFGVAALGAVVDLAVADFVPVAEFAAVPLARVGRGLSGQTPSMVITAAVGGMDAESSAGACGGAPGTACPPASVPNRTHISHRLRIKLFLQDWSVRKMKLLSTKS